MEKKKPLPNEWQRHMFPGRKIQGGGDIRPGYGLMTVATTTVRDLHISK
jgi:hypothetical protein